MTEKSNTPKAARRAERRPILITQIDHPASAALCQRGCRMKNLTVSVPDDLYAKAQQQAKKEDRSLASLVRIALEKHLNLQPK